MGSTRFPGKTLADIQGRPMLEFLLNRVKNVSEIDQIIVATTVNKDDDAIINYLKDDRDVTSFRGSSEDVLARYFEAAKKWGADVIVRLTGDDPLKDSNLISKAIKILHSQPKLDYVSTSLRPTFPEGLDVEVFRMGALEFANHHAKLLSEREHVTPYIWKNPKIFNLYSLEQNKDQSDWRWTVDKQVDLEFVRAIYAHFKDNPLVGHKEITAFLGKNPEIRAINAGIVRNEGYLSSLKRDT